MSSRRKTQNSPGPNELKASVIRRHGTIANFIRITGASKGTVYSALKYRRNGPEAKRIRELASIR